MDWKPFYRCDIKNQTVKWDQTEAIQELILKTLLTKGQAEVLLSRAILCKLKNQ